MKLIKFFLDKILIFLVAVLLQIGIYFYIYHLNLEYVWMYHLLLFLVRIAMTLYIINNPMNPGFKIAWIVFLLLFPISCIIIYMFFGRKQSGHSMFRKMNSLFKEASNFITEQHDSVLERLRQDNKHAYLQANYIKNRSLCPIYDKYHCSYYSPGETAFPVILEELEQAQKYIFIEFFIIENGLFWDSILDILIRKVHSGVDVRVIYDEVGSLLTLPNGYDKKLNALGIKCKIFNPAIPILSVSLNNRDHRKIIIVDGKTAFTGGFNLADEYIGQKDSKAYYKDSVLRVKGPAVQNFLMMFLSSWNYLNSSVEDMDCYFQYSDITINQSCKGYIQPYSDTPLDREGINETVFLNLINRATDYIYITTPYLIIDNELITALCNAAKSGIDVRIITPKIPDRKPVHKITQSYYPTLLESKIKIYEYSVGFIHSKTVTVDDQYCIVGSVNFDYRSLYLNFECAVWMYQVDCIQDVKKDFLKTQNISDTIKYENCKKQNWVGKLIITILRIFAPMF